MHLHWDIVYLLHNLSFTHMSISLWTRAATLLACFGILDWIKRSNPMISWIALTDMPLLYWKKKIPYEGNITENLFCRSSSPQIFSPFLHCVCLFMHRIRSWRTFCDIYHLTHLELQIIFTELIFRTLLWLINWDYYYIIYIQ